VDLKGAVDVSHVFLDPPSDAVSLSGLDTVGMRLLEGVLGLSTYLGKALRLIPHTPWVSCGWLDPAARLQPEVGI